MLATYGRPPELLARWIGVGNRSACDARPAQPGAPVDPLICISIGGVEESPRGHDLEYHLYLVLIV